MSTETLMTAETENTTDVPTESQPAANAPATAADAGGQAAAQPQATADADEPKAEPEGAPEKYDFTAPEGLSYDETILSNFSEVAKELNLPQAQAQKVLDKMAPVIAQRQQEQFQAARQQWAEESRADQEFGGDKLQENLGHAKRAMDTFATPELRQMLDDSGFGNNPEVIRLFVRVGKAIGEDGIVTGKPAGNKPSAQKLYAASDMNP